MKVKVCDMIMGAGKAQEMDALVLCEQGYKTMRDMAVGDHVFGEDGNLHTVIGVYPQGVKKICSVTFSDGTSTRCCEDHLWTFQHPQDKAIGRYRTASIKDIRKMPLYQITKRGNKNWQVFIPITKPVNFSAKRLTISPYVLGVILGDGGISGKMVNITNTEADMIDRVRSLLNEYGFTLDRWGDSITYGIHDIYYESTGRNRMIGMLRELGLMGKCSDGKFVPNEYLYSCMEDRLALMRGLMDTDGSVERSGLSYSTASEQLAKDIVFLAQSLGGTASYSERHTKYSYKNGIRHGRPSYRVNMKAPSGVKWFSSVKHTATASQFTQHTEPCRSIRKIEYVGEAECQCIMVDSAAHLYMTNDFIVTHNTESAITLMNNDCDSRYIFITPYLAEVERIKASCSGRDFKDPQPKGEGKLEDLHTLLAAKKNIASTHALFRRYNQETISLIQDGGYKLILDEVFEVTKVIDISQKDFKLLTDQKVIEADEDGRVRWTLPEYEGKFDELRDMCMTGNVIMYNGCLLLWLFPVEVFHAFRDVIVLTYMFDAQVQRYYFDMCGVEIQQIGTVYERGEYHFCDYPHRPDYVGTLHEKIHILEDARLNAIGESYGNLSSSWFQRAKKEKGQPMLKRMKSNLNNLFRHKWSTSASQNLWTVFKDYEKQIKGGGYSKGFLSCNVRATNAYRDRDHLAYCVNIFYNPLLKNYFKDHGVEVREDEYALSEMIQWIWRSAIRDGREISIYVPSRRMRDLLRQWLLDLSSPVDDEAS